MMLRGLASPPLPFLRRPPMVTVDEIDANGEVWEVTYILEPSLDGLGFSFKKIVKKVKKAVSSVGKAVSKVGSAVSKGLKAVAPALPALLPIAAVALTPFTAGTSLALLPAGLGLVGTLSGALMAQNSGMSLQQAQGRAMQIQQQGQVPNDLMPYLNVQTPPMDPALPEFSSQLLPEDQPAPAAGRAGAGDLSSLLAPAALLLAAVALARR